MAGFAAAGSLAPQPSEPVAPAPMVAARTVGLVAEQGSALAECPVAPAGPAPVLADLRGLWTRSLIAWPDGQQDTTSRVLWLQGAAGYIDLRQPADLPAFPAVRCLDDLTWDDCRALATQQGFAGTFYHDGTAFVWERTLDYQPAAPTPDSGFLSWQGAMLVEAGRHQPYVEHWHREPPVSAPELASVPPAQPQCVSPQPTPAQPVSTAPALPPFAPDRAASVQPAPIESVSPLLEPTRFAPDRPASIQPVLAESAPASVVSAPPESALPQGWQGDDGVLLRLRERDTGCVAMALRVGPYFMFAQAAAWGEGAEGLAGSAVPPTLLEAVEAASTLSMARQLVSCEISFGHLHGPGGVPVIVHSTLPWRVGCAFHLSATADGALATPGQEADGRSCLRIWDRTPALPHTA